MKPIVDLTVALTLSATLCTTMTGCMTGPQLTVTNPDLYVGTMGEDTRFEREMARPVELDDDGKGKKVTPALFWTGAVIGIAGTVGAISFGAAGAAMDNKLDDGFANGMTVDEEKKLRDQGKVFNGVAIGSLAAALVGIGVASIVYGIDYTRCGPMAPKKRRCKEAGRGE